MTTEHAGQPHSDAGLLRLLRLPIMLVLMFTSLPAGVAVPSAAAGVYLAVRHPPPPPRYMKLDTADHPSHTRWLVGVSIVGLAALAVHAGMTRLAWRRWDGFLLGFRGGAWFALLWTTFAVGFVPVAVFLIAYPSSQW